MDSIWTQYGKLTKRRSGSGGRLSDRDKWILENLSFLSRHIYRIPNRSGIDLGFNIFKFVIICAGVDVFEIVKIQGLFRFWWKRVLDNLTI